jgi:hypothetical protein
MPYPRWDQRTELTDSWSHGGGVHGSYGTGVHSTHGCGDVELREEERATVVCGSGEEGVAIACGAGEEKLAAMAVSGRREGQQSNAWERWWKEEDKGHCYHFHLKLFSVFERFKCLYCGTEGVAIYFSFYFEMAEEGFLRACLPAVGVVELLLLVSFSSCSFEIAEGFSRAFLPSGVSPGPIIEVLGLDVPTLA